MDKSLFEMISVGGFELSGDYWLNTYWAEGDQSGWGGGMWTSSGKEYLTSSNNGNRILTRGLKVVVTLKNEAVIQSGSGSRDDPYVLENSWKTTAVVGDWVSYNGYIWRVFYDAEDGNYRLILGELVEEFGFPHDLDEAGDTMREFLGDVLLKYKGAYRTSGVFAEEIRIYR